MFKEFLKFAGKNTLAGTSNKKVDVATASKETDNDVDLDNGSFNEIEDPLFDEDLPAFQEDIPVSTSSVQIISNSVINVVKKAAIIKIPQVSNL